MKLTELFNNPNNNEAIVNQFSDSLYTSLNMFVNPACWRIHARVSKAITKEEIINTLGSKFGLDYEDTEKAVEVKFRDKSAQYEWKQILWGSNKGKLYLTQRMLHLPEIQEKLYLLN